MPERVFALDIGTRTVIGSLVELRDGKMQLLAQKMTEHDSRAVFDGQIHDIPRVARAVQKVKQELEQELGETLYEVAVAAAGRSLQTRRVLVEQETSPEREIDALVCRALEGEGIRLAHQQLQQDSPGLAGGEEFYCVGYSVVSYYLNGYTISNLLGHRGKKIGAEVIATFLPASVVNSMYAVLSRVGLEPVCLTLEPIAAAAVAIPENFRLLNLALVDIGAGTSDIAISRDGTIVAYGMVPVAGDEITEMVAEVCLADFQTAEEIKRRLAGGGEIVYQDIMGLENSIPAGELLAQIEPALDRLAEKIVAEILVLNNNLAPKSVFLVGGGGQVPGLADKIAAGLQIPRQRVGLRERKHLSDVQVIAGDIAGPEGVTVLGIARVALSRMGHDFIKITVNGRDYRLLWSRQLTVADALGLIEYDLRSLLAKNGADLVFYVNGERRVVFGELGQPATIVVNGQEASVKTAIRDGDWIEVNPARPGAPARLTVQQFLEQNYPGLDCRVEINGRPVTDCQIEIQSGDHLVLELPEGDLNRASLSPAETGKAARDGSTVGAVADVQKGVEPGEGSSPADNEGNRSGAAGRPGHGPAAPVAGGGREAALVVTLNGRPLELVGPKQHLLVDLLNHLPAEFTLPVPGRVLRFYINGREAGYTTPLQPGDSVAARWE
ncbi:MAG: cell division FtsA domain-containing protein [Bacillota bacterium]